MKKVRRKRQTLAQKAAARKRAAERRIAKALKSYMKSRNPGRKIEGVEIKRLKGGAFNVKPIKNVAAATAAKKKRRRAPARKRTTKRKRAKR